MQNITIKEIDTEKEVIEAFPIMNQLRTHLSKDDYVDLVLEAKVKDSYKLYGLFEDEHLVGLIGFKPMITLYYGRFVWVCDLVTDRDRRSEGLGEQLLQFVEDWTVHHGYKIIALSSGIQRVDTHRFYNDKMNYSKVSYVFKKHMDVE